VPTARLFRVQGAGKVVIDEHLRSIDLLPQGFHGAAPRASSEDLAARSRFCLQCGRSYPALMVTCPRDGHLLDDASHSFLWLG
jgi:hypothetical protein